jgi:hypothetical protein
MKHFLQITAIALSVASSCPSRAQMGEEEPPVRANVVYASKYVVRGAARAGDSAQIGVQFAREALRGGIKINQPFDASDSRELGLRLSRGWQVSEHLGLSAMVNHTWFDRTPGVDRSLEAGVAATFSPVGEFTPSLSYSHDFRFDADSVEASVARSVPLTKLGAFLEFSFYAGSVQGRDWRPDQAGARRQDGYEYFGGEVRLPYRVGANATLELGLHYADSLGRSASNGPFSRQGGGRIWLSFGVNADF